jgi:hypothetical protein
MAVVFAPMVRRLGSCSIAGLSGTVDHEDCLRLISDVYVIIGEFPSPNSR